MATVKRLLSDIDNKVEAEKKKPEPFESVISKWASDGFDEKTHPYASGSGKGVFHQAKFLHTFDPEEKFDVPVKASFDFGSASKKKAIADLNKRLSGHGIMASVSYPDDDSGNDQIIFSKIPQENKKINPKQVYEGASNAEQEKTRAELARREAEAAAPKEPGLRGAWKDEILRITDKNKRSFLDENGFDKDFYWVGNDLVSKKTGESVYSLPPRAGAQSSLILKRMGYGADAEKALTARRNQVRADLEKRTGRKYSDDEWAAIVELASQLR